MNTEHASSKILLDWTDYLLMTTPPPFGPSLSPSAHSEATIVPYIRRYVSLREIGDNWGHNGLMRPWDDQGFPLFKSFLTHSAHVNVTDCYLLRSVEHSYCFRYLAHLLTLNRGNACFCCCFIMWCKQFVWPFFVLVYNLLFLLHLLESMNHVWTSDVIFVWRYKYLIRIKIKSYMITQVYIRFACVQPYEAFFSVVYI